MVYDLIIIGAGPAGLAAAVYAARQKISFAVISKDVGGQTAWSSDVENYLGFHLVSGSELVLKFEEHLKDYNIDLKREEVLSLEKRSGTFAVRTAQGEYEAKTVLIASGKIPRRLNVPGEKEYLGRGVTYCATCDAPVFSGKDVAVIGGGNSATDAALLAEKYSNKVYLVNVNSELRGEKQMIDAIAKSNKIQVMNRAAILAIKGNEFVKSIEVSVADKEVQEFSVQGVFVEIGSVPSVSFDKLTEKNKFGEIIIHEDKENYLSNLTSVPGVFAAGDVSDVPEKQIIVAGGEGVKAVLSVFKHLSKTLA